MVQCSVAPSASAFMKLPECTNEKFSRMGFSCMAGDELWEGGWEQGDVGGDIGGSKERCNEEGHVEGLDASALYSDTFALLLIFGPLSRKVNGIGLVFAMLSPESESWSLPVSFGWSSRISTTCCPSKTLFLAKTYCNLDRVIPT